MTDDLFVPLTPPNPAAPKPKCRRHSRLPVHFVYDAGRQLWHVEQIHPAPTVVPCEPGVICTTCWKRLDPLASQRGKRNKDRGLTIQRRVLTRMGLDSIPGNGPTDGRSRGENGLFLAEVKSGGRFSETDYNDMAKLPARAGQVRLLVKVETPGSGRRARATVTMPLEDWLALHGPTT